LVTVLVPIVQALVLTSLSPLTSLSVKPTLQAILVFGLLLTPSVDGVAASVRADRPIDVELDQSGALSGEIPSVDHVPRDVQRVLVYSGRRLVARVPVTTRGNFRIDGLDGGLYWVTASVAGQAVRVWAPSTAPPQSQRRLVLIATPRSPQLSSTGTTLGSRSPYVSGSPTAYVASPMPTYAASPMPSYPFQPYQVPGGGMMFPGTYTSPGSIFFNPLVTAAVVTGVAGVIVVVTDDDDSSVAFGGPGSP